MRIAILVVLLLIICAFSFSEEVLLFLKTQTFKVWVDITVAIGTLLTAIGAFYFGLFGNFESRMLLKKKENELDLEAFKLLGNSPLFILGREGRLDIDGGVTVANYINNFEKKVLSEHISRNTQKRYLKYISLVYRFTDSYTIYGNNKTHLKCFATIKKETEKLGSHIDSGTKKQYLRAINNYDSFYWNKKIFLIEPNDLGTKQKTAYVYTDTNETHQCIRNLVTQHLSEEPESLRNFYQDERESFVTSLSPKEFDLIKRNNRKIKFFYHNKRITLSYNKPQLI